jgi:hypothetical protein
MAAPLLQQAVLLRALGVPHIALRKMLSAGIIGGVVAVPLAVIFAIVLAPFGASIGKAAPWIFLAAALAIAYHTAGRWSSVLLLVPFVLLIVGLRTLTEKYGVKLTISYYLGIAIGPLIADLFAVLSPVERRKMRRAGMSTFSLAPDVKAWGGYFPNPLRVLDRQQTMWAVVTGAVSSATFVFSPIAMTVILGELVGARIKHSYQRLTTVIAVRNAVTEATFIAEVTIPLMAFGLPLSPIAAGPAAALFNAPPRFSADAATGHINNLHTLMSGWEFLGYGLLSVLLAALISYPLAMNYAHRAASFVSRRLSHEAIIAVFAGLIVVIGTWEGQALGLLVILTVGLFGGLLSRLFAFNTGVQFMGYYVAILTVPALVGLL